MIGWPTMTWWTRPTCIQLSTTCRRSICTTIPRPTCRWFWDEPGYCRFPGIILTLAYTGAQLVDNGENIEGLFAEKFSRTNYSPAPGCNDVTAGALGGLLVPEQAVVYRMNNPVFTW